LVADQFVATSFQSAALAAYWIVNSARSIVLIGFMGAGKSSVGRCLERLTGLARVDVDERIVSKAGLSISEIFSQHGEQHFREAETQVLRELSANRHSIIVTGGGIVLRQENVDLLKKLGTIVWLDADEEKLFQRASRRGERPLLQTENPRKTFSELFQSRRSAYDTAADFRIDTTLLTHDEVAEKILSEIEMQTATKQ
jgi:shikimate kinase